MCEWVGACIWTGPGPLKQTFEPWSFKACFQRHLLFERATHANELCVGVGACVHVWLWGLGFCDIARWLQGTISPSRPYKCLHTNSRTHTHTKRERFAAAGDSFLIFHSNNCGLALILVNRAPGLKGWLTVFVCVCLCVNVCVHVGIVYDNYWTDRMWYEKHTALIDRSPKHYTQFCFCCILDLVPVVFNCSYIFK